MTNALFYNIARKANVAAVYPVDVLMIMRSVVFHRQTDGGVLARLRWRDDDDDVPRPLFHMLILHKPGRRSGRGGEQSFRQSFGWISGSSPLIVRAVRYVQYRYQVRTQCCFVTCRTVL